MDWPAFDRVENNPERPTTDLLKELSKRVGDSRNGLPEEVFLFVSQLTPLINVDLLIRNDASETLLTWRSDDYYGSGWHVPGGVIRFQERSIDRVAAVAATELGASVTVDPQPVAINELIQSSRNARGHFISLLYRCRLLTTLDEHRRHIQGRPRAGAWQWHSSCPPDLLPIHEIYRPIF